MGHSSFVVRCVFSSLVPRPSSIIHLPSSFNSAALGNLTSDLGLPTSDLREWHPGKKPVAPEFYNPK